MSIISRANTSRHIIYHRLDSLYMNNRPATVQDYANGGFVNWSNCFIAMPPVLNVVSIKLKYFRCDNVFYLFSKGFNTSGNPLNDLTTFYVQQPIGVYHKVYLEGSYGNNGPTIAAEITSQLSASGSSVVCTYDTSRSKFIFRNTIVSPFPHTADEFIVDFQRANAVDFTEPSQIGIILGYYINAPFAGGADINGNLLYYPTNTGTEFYSESSANTTLFYPQLFRIILTPLPQNNYDSSSKSVTYTVSNDGTDPGKPYLFTENNFYQMTVEHFKTDITGYQVQILDRFDNYLIFGANDWNMLLELTTEVPA